MSYVFGAATGDDINWNGVVTIGGAPSVFLFTGWFLPTTLTATRRYWSSGAIVGAEVDSTTSEIRMKSDNATTDGNWVTTGAGIVVNQWKFIAWLGTFNNTGPAGAWRVWVGDASSPPTEVTVTQATAPVGNFTGSSSYTLGNAGSAGSVSFQGNIAQASVVARENTVVETFRLATAGAITQAEADRILQRFVIPLWAGTFSPLDCNMPPSNNATTAETAALDTPTGVTVFRQTFAVSNPFVASVNGATYSQEEGPRRTYYPHPTKRYNFVRR